MKELLLITIGAQIGVIIVVSYLVAREAQRQKRERDDNDRSRRDPRHAL